MSGKKKKEENSTGKHCSVFVLLSDITYHSVKDTEYFFFFTCFYLSQRFCKGLVESQDIFISAQPSILHLLRMVTASLVLHSTAHVSDQDG